MYRITWKTILAADINANVILLSIVAACYIIYKLCVCILILSRFRCKAHTRFQQVASEPRFRSKKIMVSFLEAQVPMLTGTNYGDGSIQMKELLGSYDIWDIVESGYEEPTSAAEVGLSDAEKMALNGRRSKNNKACFLIYQGVDEFTFDNIAHVKKAKDAWEILQEIISRSQQRRRGAA